jgi:diacylglycerol kinase (ATP)
MHVLLVRNRAAGSADEVDPAAMLLRSGCVVTEAEPDVATRWAHAPPRSVSDVERVIVAGGDGTIGTAAALAVALDAPLGIVPAGTANDFARAVGVPDDPEQAMTLAAKGDQLRPVDLARIDGVPFVNVASMGLAPAAATSARPLKRGIGALAYPVGALFAAVRSQPTSLVARVDDNIVFSGRVWQVMAASTGAFGGWAATGSTRQGDGMLDLVVIPADRDLRELAGDAAALLRAELAEREGIIHARGNRLELALRRPPRAVVDGEIMHIDSRQVVATVDPTPVQVIVG